MIYLEEINREGGLAFIKPGLIKKSVILRMVVGVFKHMVFISEAKMANTWCTF